MAEGVTGDTLFDASRFGGACDCLLHAVFVDVMAAELVGLIDQLSIDFAGLGISAEMLGWEEVLPGEAATRGGVFSVEGVWQPDPAGAGLHVAVVLRFDEFKLFVEMTRESRWHGNHSVLFALAVADGDLQSLEVEVFDSDSAAFQQPQAAAVKQSGDEAIGAFGDMVQETANFVDAKDDRESIGSFSANGIELDFEVEDLGVEKKQCRECLVLGAGGDTSIDGE